MWNLTPFILFLHLFSLGFLIFPQSLLCTTGLNSQAQKRLLSASQVKQSQVSRPLDSQSGSAGSWIVLCLWCLKTFIFLEHINFLWNKQIELKIRNQITRWIGPIYRCNLGFEELCQLISCNHDCLPELTLGPRRQWCRLCCCWLKHNCVCCPASQRVPGSCKPFSFSKMDLINSPGLYSTEYGLLVIDTIPYCFLIKY